MSTPSWVTTQAGRVSANPERRRLHERQSGFGMLEVMLTLGLTTLILVPLFGWFAFALRGQAPVGAKTEDVAGVGRARTVFSRDVASAMSAATTGADCTGGAGAGGTVRLVLTSSSATAARVVYTEAPQEDAGVVSATAKSVWRRVCVGTAAPSSSLQLVRDLAAPVTVTCLPRPSVPLPDTCGQVRLSTTTAQRIEPVSLNGARRWTGLSVEATSGTGKQAPIPVIAKTQSNPNGYRNLLVNFDSSGSTDPDGTIVSYYWTFGDGSPPSTEQNPSHTYTAVGVFPVTLTVTDNDGAPRTAYTSVTVNNRLPVAVIANTDATLTGGKPLTIAFSSVGSNDTADPGGAITSYQWVFGDGTPNSTSANPSHTYTKSGSYQVTLTVMDNDGGTSSAMKTVTVTNTPPNVTAIGWTCQAGTTPCASGTTNSAIGTTTSTLATNFTSTAADTDGGTITAWEWSVTPSATIATPSAQNTTITFPSPGTYTVTLKVKDDDNAWSAPFTRTVKVNAPPTAAFTKSHSNNDGYRPITVTLDATTSSDADGGIASYQWTTSDGKSATGSTASFTWSNSDLAGVRTITLTVTDTNGATASTSKTISLVNRAPTVTLTTSPDPPAGPKPLAVTFTANGSDPDGTAVTYRWTVNGIVQVGATSPTFSYTFGTTATSTVQVTVTDIDGATALKDVNVTPGNVPPTVSSLSFVCHASVPSQYCTNGVNGSVIGSLSPSSLVTSFSGAGTETDGGTIQGYEWSVSPAASISNASAANTTITFSSAGSYSVSFRVKDNDGAWSPLVTKTVIVNAPPSASFTVPAGGRAPQTRTFTGSASDPEGTTISYSWSITGPDNFSPTGQSASVTFNKPGTYTVKLTASDIHGGSTTTAAQTLIITGPPPPTLSRAGGARCTGFLCLGSGYIDINITNRPTNVSLFEMKIVGTSGIWPCAGTGTTRQDPFNVSNPVRWNTGCIYNLTWNIQVRSFDQNLSIWGDWSGTYSMSN